MPVVHEDAAIDTLFLETELESVSAEVYAKYPEARYSALIPVDSSDDEGAESVGYLMFDSIGQSAIIAAGTTDSPAVDAFVTKKLLPVHELGNHYKYDYRELRNAKKAGRRIDSMRARVSATSIEQQHDEIAMLGDGTANKRFGGMYGIVFHPNVTKMASPKTFALATDAEILSYFASMVVRVVKDTKEIFRPNTFGIADEVVAYLEGRMIAGTDTSLMERIRKTYPGFSFETHYVLENVGKNPTTGVVGDCSVILCYYKSTDVLCYKQPMTYKTYPPVPQGRSVKIEAASTSAGVEVRQPLAVVVFHSF